MNNFIDWLARVILVVSTIYTTIKFIFWLVVVCFVLYWSAKNWQTVIAMKDKLLASFLSAGKTVVDARSTANEIIITLQKITAESPDLLKNINDQVENLKNLDLTKQFAELELLKNKIEEMDSKLDEIKRKLNI